MGENKMTREYKITFMNRRVQYDVHFGIEDDGSLIVEGATRREFTPKGLLEKGIGIGIPAEASVITIGKDNRRHWKKVKIGDN